MRMRKTLAAGTRRYATKKNVPKRSTVKPASRLPFGQVMQNLLPLVGLMRKMSLEGGATSRNPKLILTGSGLELSFSTPDTPSTLPEQSIDRVAEMERSLKLLATTVDSLGAAVKLNEEMLESLVDSLTAADDLSFGQSDLPLGPKTLAS
jgi:hypothetical protein